MIGLFALFYDFCVFRYCDRLFEPFGASKAPVIENGKILDLVSYQDRVFKGMMAED